MELRHVVTCFLVRPGDGRVLLGERSEDVGTYPGRWAAVSGSVEEAGPRKQAFREIKEETGLRRSDVELAAEGLPVRSADWDLNTLWVVHPYRFRCLAPERVRRDWEHIRFDWTEPDHIPQRETVPRLTETWQAVARHDGRPDPGAVFQQVRADREHGAEELGLRTLTALRWAAEGPRERFRELCRAALSLRPSMAPVLSAGLEAGALARDTGRGGGLVQALEDLIARRELAPLRAAECAAGRIPDGSHVVTLSYSFSVLATLRGAAGRIGRLSVAESRPAREGRRTAELAASFAIPAELVTDAAAVRTAAEADLVLTGADSLLPDGSVVNKTGTFALCCGAAWGGARTLVVASESKVLPVGHRPEMETMDPSELGESLPGVNVRNPCFETVPADLVSEIVTERGPVRAEQLGDRARELQRARHSLSGQ